MPNLRHECSLIFSDGKSSKFWKLVLEGNSHTTTFGKLGTAGRTQTKNFPSEHLALTAYHRLFFEKLRKGYVEAVPGSATGTAAAPTESTPGNPAAVTSRRSRKSAVNPPETAVADVDLSFAPEIDLQPFQWYRAGVCTRPPLAREVSPFSLKESVRRLSSISTNRDWLSAWWQELDLSPVMSPEEACFWFVAMTESPEDHSMAKFAKKLSERSFDGTVTRDAIIERLECNRGSVPPELGAALANVLTVDDYVDIMTRETATRGDNCYSRGYWNRGISERYRHTAALAEGFSRYAVPYLTSAQRETLCRRVDQKLADHDGSVNSDGTILPEYYLAAALGMQEWIRRLISGWDADRFLSSWEAESTIRPQLLLFGLGSGEQVASEWRRLKLRMRSIHDVQAFLACTQDTAIDCILDSILAETDRNRCSALVRGLALARTSSVAGAMLQCRQSSAAPAVAREWLTKNVGRAVAGLVNVAGEQARISPAIYEYLQEVKRRGFASVIEEVLRNSTRTQVVQKIRAEVLDRDEPLYVPFDENSTPAWLKKELAAVGAGKSGALPVWATPAMLPPLIVGDHKLSDEQIQTVLQMLRTTIILQKHPLWTALRTHVTASIRDAFVWKLFQLWQEDGSPSKHKWAMEAIGNLGDDGCVLKLTPLIRVWPGESQHARAVFGLECLRAIGSTTALMQLASIAQKLKFQGLRQRAERFVSEIARERGLTQQQLEDQMVPDCGLDEQGRREFSFGARKFSFVLGADLKPRVRDLEGKLRPDLPTPGVRDDALLAAESIASWKLLKKQIGDVAKTQARRLEQAMVAGRRWNIDSFTTLFVRHPLMIHLTRNLIWCGFDEAGERTLTFRVTEERDFADVDDNAVSLTDAHTVAIVHPLYLSETERSRWGEVLGDYEITAPFPQLGRTVYSLSPDERQAERLAQFCDLQIPAPSLVFTLEKLGWIRGATSDAGLFDQHFRHFPAADLTAVVAYEGMVGMHYIEAENLLVVESVHFVEGCQQLAADPWAKVSKLKLEEVPPIVISEIVADMQLLKSKAK
jgi:predicted DNA-binding WGR domain protein